MQFSRGCVFYDFVASWRLTIVQDDEDYADSAFGGSENSYVESLLNPSALGKADFCLGTRLP